MSRIVLVLLSLFTFSSAVKASINVCSSDLTKSEELIENLVDRTNNIVLAQAIRSERFIADSKLPAPLDYKPTHTYTFKTIKVIKGKVENEFSLELFKLERNTHFEHHNTGGFWRNCGGRAKLESSGAIQAGFKNGDVYLIFLDKPYWVKSFEKIVDYQNDQDMDKWLKYVVDRVAEYND